LILLVDAHAVLWWLGGTGDLAETALSAIADPANDVVVSTATVWEIEIKRSRGKLQSPPDILGALGSRVSLLPIIGEDAVAAAALPPLHRDPFDRMVIAQAKRLGAVIITRDPAFAAYDVETLSA
jgi:PIN domain nuclease of toxin-antitoxin system